GVSGLRVGPWAWAVGRWALGVGRWALGVGRWALGVGIFCGARRTLNPERSTFLPAKRHCLAFSQLLLYSRAFTETSAPAPSGHRQKSKPGPMSGETDEDPTGHRYEYCLHRFVDSFPGRTSHPAWRRHSAGQRRTGC